MRLLSPSVGPGERTFWIVNALYGPSFKGPIYAHIQPLRECTGAESFERIYRKITSETRPVVVRLNENIRRVMALHDCCSSPLDACYSASSGRINHSDQGEDLRWTIIGSTEGFPIKAR